MYLGTSAGTDCQTAKTMITGGLSYNGLRDGAATHWHTQQPGVYNFCCTFHFFTLLSIAKYVSTHLCVLTY